MRMAPFLFSLFSLLLFASMFLFVCLFVCLFLPQMGLLQRDYANFKPFFDQLGVSSSCGEYSPDVDVVYILRSEIEHSYRRRVFKGFVPPFPDTVLIVDEVDELIVDGTPNSYYVKPDVERGAGFATAVRCISEAQAKPESITDTTWALAQKACALADTKVESTDYVVTSDSVVELVRGRRTTHTSDWLRVLRQRKHGKNATVDSYFFIQNVSHMFSQYQAIMGLSGSLGSPAERAFLQKVFRAEFVHTPSFLDTCNGVKKHQPALNNNTVIIRDNQFHQFTQVLQLVSEKQNRVPIVIVCENPHVANQLHTFLVSKQTNDCQLLLEHDENGRMDYSSIVDNATKPIESGRNKTWRVTVTDYFGGRGHDYRINDEDVDADGGLLVIALSIPQSEREFVQWKGRTARSDRQGQYALILNAEDAPLKGNKDRWKEHRCVPKEENEEKEDDQVNVNDCCKYKESIITCLLGISDEKTNENLNKLRRNIIGGQRLNELCDKFYKIHKSTAHGKWPSGIWQQKLRDFLDNIHASSVDADTIATFAVKVNLASSTHAWKRQSSYTCTD